MKKDKFQKRSDKVVAEMARVLRTPHHPSRCPAAGMFGKHCKNCDANVKP